MEKSMNLDPNLSNYTILTKFALQVIGVWPCTKRLKIKLVNAFWYTSTSSIIITVVNN